MFQSVTDFWWPKPPTPPANTEISAPNYGFVLFQQYFNDAIDPAQSTPIIITTVVIAILVLFLMLRKKHNQNRRLLLFGISRNKAISLIRLMNFFGFSSLVAPQERRDEILIASL